MTSYVVHVRLSRGEFQQLVEQANRDGQSLEKVAASLIGNNLERKARARERDRRARIDWLSRQMDKKPPIDPVLHHQFDVALLRRLAGIFPQD